MNLIKDTKIRILFQSLLPNKQITIKYVTYVIYKNLLILLVFPKNNKKGLVIYEAFFVYQNTTCEFL